jgi:hypothetical protein
MQLVSVQPHLPPSLQDLPSPLAQGWAWCRVRDSSLYAVDNAPRSTNPEEHPCKTVDHNQCSEIRCLACNYELDQRGRQPISKRKKKPRTNPTREGEVIEIDADKLGTADRYQIYCKEEAR